MCDVSSGSTNVTPVPRAHSQTTTSNINKSLSAPHYKGHIDIVNEHSRVIDHVGSHDKAAE